MNVRKILLDSDVHCPDPGCDICTLGQQPNESRADWLARLKVRFSGKPLRGKYAANQWTKPHSTHQEKAS